MSTPIQPGQVIAAADTCVPTAKQSLAYLVMVKETLGDDWLTPDLFRFGASTLLNDVLMQVAKTVDGRYQGADYFSLP